MHQDRIGCLTDAAWFQRNDRVRGFGAPVSVLIRAPAREVGPIRRGVAVERARHAEQAPPARELDAYEQWDAERRQWDAMADDVASVEGSELVLLWPTPYAGLVLAAAVADAERTVERVPRDNGARLTLASVRETLEAFIAVDRGGLQEVHL